MVHGDRGSARAFAVNPLRLKTHPCGLRGLTALSTAKRGGYHAKIKKSASRACPPRLCLARGSWRFAAGA
jgi:hypothetical protein